MSRIEFSISDYCVFWIAMHLRICFFLWSRSLFTVIIRAAAIRSNERNQILQEKWGAVNLLQDKRRCKNLPVLQEQQRVEVMNDAFRPTHKKKTQFLTLLKFRRINSPRQTWLWCAEKAPGWLVPFPVWLRVSSKAVTPPQSQVTLRFC